MFASVDVGTNTVRLLIAQVRNDTIEPVRIFRHITRLGGGFSPESGLAPDAAERTLSALRQIAVLCREAGVTRLRAVGTAVLRRAPDGNAFAARVRNETGLPLEIIDGDEEARLSALGIRSVLDPVPEISLIVDIGGGSTEFVLTKGSDILFARSYYLGVVSLCESHPLAFEQGDQIAGVLDHLFRDLARDGLDILASDGTVVGTAGTVTTMAALKLQMREYDPHRVNNLQITRSELDELLKMLEPLSIEEREALPGMEKGRGDLILPGIRIVRAVLERFDRNALTVSDAGLLEGVLLSLDRR